MQNRDDVLESIVMMAKYYTDNAGSAQEIMEHAGFDISRKFAKYVQLVPFIF